MLPQRPLESHTDTMDTPLGMCPTCMNIICHMCCGKKQLGITPLEIQRKEVLLMICSGFLFSLSLCPLLPVTFILNLTSLLV